jgi:hypothetical protein
MRQVLCDDRTSAAAPAIAVTAGEDIAAAASHQPDACLVKAGFPGAGDGLRE